MIPETREEIDRQNQEARDAANWIRAELQKPTTLLEWIQREARPQVEHTQTKECGCIWEWFNTGGVTVEPCSGHRYSILSHQQHKG